MKPVVVAMLAVFAAACLASPALAKNDKPKKNDPPPAQGGNGGGQTAYELGASLCRLSDISPGAAGCLGWYEGNLNAGNPDAKDASAAALNALLGVTSYEGAALTWLQNIDSLSGPTVNFDQLLFGQTVVAFHVGGANGGDGVGYSGSAFYVFDAGSAGLDSFTFNIQGLSNARLYATGSAPPSHPPTLAVPEPATWALMILGFGGAGAALRYRRRLAAA